MKGDHAAVIGGSVAGLLAAAALARHFDTVTVLEKDALPDGPAARRGAPQGRHAHVLVQGGRDALGVLFPEEAAELAATGTIRTDGSLDLRWFQFGVWKRRYASGLDAHWCDRPRFEHGLRERIAATPNVRLLAGHRATALIADSAAGIGGVRVGTADGDERDLAADLVVDASGGGTRTPRQLEELGYPRVHEDQVRVDVGYASRIYRLRQGLDPDWSVLVIYPRPPESRRAGVVYPLDDGRSLVTLIGWVGDHPGVDEAAFLDFARSLPQPDVHVCLDGAEPLSPIRRHAFPASRWRRFERMARWPERLVVVGDAVCGFNPVYGQGMTVSALDAVALGHALERSPDPGSPGFARRLQRELAKHRTVPWLLAATSDFRFPEVIGSRPPALGLMNWYTQGVLEIAGESRRAHQGFIEVLGFRASPLALFRPAIAFDVLRHSLARRRGGRRPQETRPAG